MKINKLFKQLKKERLSPEEKSNMLAAIVQAQREFPARETAKKMSWTFWRMNPMARLAAAALSILIILGISGGTVLAAESSLPGDILYPIKINVTERARAAIAITPARKAVVEERLAERRLEELEKLVEQKRLTPKQEAETSARFETHKANMEKNIIRLKDDGENKQLKKLRERLADFTEKKETRILNVLNVQIEKVEEEIKADDDDQNKEKPNDARKSKETKIKIREKPRQETIKTEVVVPALPEIINQLQIEQKKQREEPGLQTETGLPVDRMETDKIADRTEIQEPKKDDGDKRQEVKVEIQKKTEVPRIKILP